MHLLSLGSPRLCFFGQFARALFFPRYAPWLRRPAKLTVWLWGKRRFVGLRHCEVAGCAQLSWLRRHKLAHYRAIIFWARLAA
jgi:hypothetical protein